MVVVYLRDGRKIKIRGADSAMFDDIGLDGNLIVKENHATVAVFLYDEASGFVVKDDEVN